MVKLKSRKPQRERAFGTIALVEDKEGKLQMHCDIMETDGASPEIMARIRAAVAGLAFLYEHDADDIDKLGGAYLSGLETGITLTQNMHKKKDGEEPKAGFHAKI